MSKAEEHPVELVSTTVTNEAKIDGMDLGKFTSESVYMIDGNRVKYSIVSHGGCIGYVTPMDLVGYFRDHGAVHEASIDGDYMENTYGLCSCREAFALVIEIDDK